MGGGPAGAKAAEAAARAGARTVLVERERSIAETVRTSGGMALQTVREFEIPEQYYHPITRIRLASPNEAAIFVSEQPFGCIIDVRETFRFLARRAERAGAIVATGVEVLAPIVHDGHVVGCSVRIDEQTHTMRARVIVDASGYRATLAKAAGVHPGFARVGVGAEYEVVSSLCRQDEMVLAVGNRYAPSGYAWVFPWGEKRVRIGVGLLHADTREDPRKLLKRFIAEIDRYGVELGDHEIVDTHYGLIPASGLTRRMVTRGLIAAGDAAGVATLVVGEGLRLSMISGEMAGRAAAAAAQSPSGSEASLRRYESEFRKRFEFDLKLGHVVNRRMASWTDAKWDDRVRTLRGLPPGILVQFLQSHLSIRGVIGWLVLRPWLWPKITRWFIKGSLDLVRLRRRSHGGTS